MYRIMNMLLSRRPSFYHDQSSSLRLGFLLFKRGISVVSILRGLFGGLEVIINLKCLALRGNTHNVLGSHPAESWLRQYYWMHHKRCSNSWGPYPITLFLWKGKWCRDYLTDFLLIRGRASRCPLWYQPVSIEFSNGEMVSCKTSDKSKEMRFHNHPRFVSPWEL